MRVGLPQVSLCVDYRSKDVVYSRIFLSRDSDCPLSVGNESRRRGSETYKNGPY